MCYLFKSIKYVVSSLFIQNKIQLLQLWYHESCRVFQDRLVNDEDRKWFDQLLHTHIQEFGCKIEEVVPYQPVLYGDFMFPGAVKVYRLIEDKEKVKGLYSLVLIVFIKNLFLVYLLQLF